MTATEYGSLANKTAGTTFDITTAVNIPAGTLLVVGMSHDNSASATLPTATVAWTTGSHGAFTQRNSASSGTSTSAGSGIFGRVFTALSADLIPSGTVLRVTFSNSITAKAILLWGIDGFVETVRGTPGTGTSTSGTPTASTSGTALVAGDLVIGLCAGEDNNNPNTDGDTTNGTFTYFGAIASTGAGAASNAAVLMEYKIVTATGVQTYNPTTSNDSVALIFALTPSPDATVAAATVAAPGAGVPAPTPGAGQTVVVTSVIAAGVGPQLISYSDYEQSSAEFTATGSSVTSRTTTYAYSGTYSMRVYPSFSTGLTVYPGGSTYRQNYAGSTPIQPGDKVSASIMMRAGTTDVRWRMEIWYQSGGADLGWWYGPWVTPTSSGFSQLTLSHTAPATADSYRVQIVQELELSTFNYLYFDDYKFYKGSGAIPAPTVSASSLVDLSSSVVAAVTAIPLPTISAIDILDATVPNTCTPVTTVAAVPLPESPATVVASVVTAVAAVRDARPAIAVARVIATAAVPRPDLAISPTTIKAGVGGTSTTQDFETTLGTAYVYQGTLSRSTDYAVSGTYSMKFVPVPVSQPSIYFQGTGPLTPTASQGFAVTPGTRVTATVQARRHPNAGADTWAVYIWYYSSGNTLILGTPGTSVVPSSTEFTPLTASSVAPANAAWAIIAVVYDYGVIPTTDPFYFDDLVVAVGLQGYILRPAFNATVTASAVATAAAIPLPTVTTETPDATVTPAAVVAPGAAIATPTGIPNTVTATRIQSAAAIALPTVSASSRVVAAVVASTCRTDIALDFESSLGDAVGTSCALSLSTDQADSGTQSMKIVPVADSAVRIDLLGVSTATWATVSANAPVVACSAKLRRSASQPAHQWSLTLQWYNAAGASGSNAVTTNSPSSSSFTTFSVSPGNSSSSAAYAALILAASSPYTGITTDPLYVDSVVFSCGGDTSIPLPTVTTATPDATVPNTVTPVPTTAAISLPTVSASITIAAIPVVAGVCSSFTTLGFESSLGSATAADATLSLSATQAHTGAQSLRAVPTPGTQCIIYPWGSSTSGGISVSAGSRVTMAAYIRQDPSQVVKSWRLYYRCYNAANAVVGQTFIDAQQPSSTSWTLLSGAITTPAGTTHMYLYVLPVDATGITADPVYLDDISIAIGPTGSIPLPAISTDATVSPPAVAAVSAVPAPTILAMTYRWVASDIAQSDSTNVSAWVDRIRGLSLDQATSTRQPLYKTSGIGGQPAVFFDRAASTKKFMLSGAADLLKGLTKYTVIAVLQTDSGPTGGAYWGNYCQIQTTSPTDTQISLAIDGSARWEAYTSYSNLTYAPTSPTVAANEAHVAAMVFDTNQGQWYIDGTATSTGTRTLGVPNATTTETVRVGSWAGTGDWFGGHIAELLVFDYALTQDEITAVTSGLSTTYSMGGVTVTPAVVAAVAAVAQPASLVVPTPPAVAAVSAVALPTFSTSNTIAATRVIATATQPWAVPTVFVYPNRVIAVSGIQQPASLVVPTPPATAAVAAAPAVILSPGPNRITATTAIPTPYFSATVTPDVISGPGRLVDRTLLGTWSSPFYGWWSNNTIYDIKWSPLLNKVVAINQKVATSDDGLTWDPQSWIAPTTHQWGISLTETSTALWAVTDYISIVTSTNGSTWTEYQPPEIRSSGMPRKLIWVEDLGLFVLLTDHALFTSPDGTTWSVSKSSTDDWTDVAWSPALQLLVLINNGYANTIWTSPNGVDWTYRPSGADNWTATHVVWSESLQLFVVLDYWQGVLWRSSNGIDWYSSSSPFDHDDVYICDTPYGVAMGVWFYNSGVNGYLARASLLRGPTLTPDPMVSLVLSGSAGGCYVLSYIPPSDMLALGGSSAWYVTRNLATIQARIPAVILAASSDVVASSVSATAGLALPAVTGGGASTVTATFELWESGSFVGTLGTQDIVQTDGNTLVEWDLQPYLYLLADQTGAGIELRITAPSDLQIESAEWDSLYEDTGTVDASFTPSVVHAYAAVPAATPSASLAFTADLVTATASLVLPTILAVVQLQPTPATATAIIPTPTPSASLTITATLVPATATALTATAGAGQTAFPAAILAPGATIFVPTVTAIQNITIAAVTVAAVAGQPSPTEAAGSTVTQPVTLTTATIPLPTITYSATVVAVAVPAVAATPAATAGAGQTVPAVLVAATAAVPVVTQVSVGSILAAVLVTTTAAVLAPTSVTAIQNVNISAALIITAAGQPSPEESTGSTITSPSSVAGVAGVSTSFPSASLIFTAVLVTATSTLPLTGLGVGVSLSPATITASSAVALPTFQYGNSVPAVPVAAVAALPVLTLVAASSNAVAVAVAAVAAQTRPAFNVAITATLVAPPVVTVPLPTLAAASNAAPTPVVAIAALPARTTSASSNVVATRVLGTAAVPVPTPAASISFTAVLIAAVGDQPSPLESAGSTVVQPVTHTIAAIPLPTIVYGNTVPAATVVAVGSVPTSTPAASITITPASVAPPVVTIGFSFITPNPQPVSVTAAVPLPTIATDGSVITVAVGATAAVGRPDLAIGAVTAVQAVAAVPAPTPHAGTLIFQPVTVLTVAAVSLPTFTIDTNIIAACVIALAAVPTAQAAATVAVVATIVPAAVSVPRPGLDATVSAPAPVAATATVPAPAISEHVVITAALVTAPGAVPLPTVTAVTATYPNVVATVAAVPAPTPSASTVITVVPVPAVAGQPSPTEATGSTITQPVIPAPGAVIPLPTFVITATVVAAAVAAVTTVSRPAFNVTLTPAPVAAVAALPAPTPSAGVLFTAALVAAPGASVPLPTFSMGATPTPAAITAAGAVPAPTLVTSGLVLAATITAIANQPSPLESAGSLITVSAALAFAAVPVAAISVGSNLAPAAIAATAAVPLPTFSTTSILTPAVVTAVAAAPTASVIATLGAAPAVIYASAAFPTAYPSANASFTVASVSAVSIIPSATPTASSLVLAAAVQLTAALPSPVEAASSTVSASRIDAPAAAPAPTLAANSLVVAARISAVASTPAPVTTASSLVLANVLMAVGTVPAPSIGAHLGASPDTVTVVATVGAPVLAANSTVIAVAVSAVSAVPAPVLSANSLFIQWTTVGAVANQPSPTESAGATIVVSRIAVTAALGLPSFATGSTVSSAVVHGYAAVPLLALSTGMTVADGYVAAVAAIPLPTVATDGSVPPITVLVTSTVPLPSISTDQYLTADTIVTVAALPTEAASAHENITVITIAAIAAAGLPALVTEARFTAPLVAAPGAATPVFEFSSSVEIPRIAWNDVVLAYASVPFPTVRQDATATPGLIAAVATPRAPTVSASSLVFQLPSTTAAAVAVVPAPTPSAGVRITATRVTSTTTVPTPSISAGSSTTISPSRVDAVVTVPLPTVRTSALFSVSTVAVHTHVPAADVQTGSLASPAPVAVHVHIGTDYVSTGGHALPGSADATADVHAVAVYTGANAITTTVPAWVGVFTVAEVSVGSTLTLDYLRLHANIEPFTVTLAGDIVPNPVHTYAYVGQSKIIVVYPEGWGFLI